MARKNLLAGLTDAKLTAVNPEPRPVAQPFTSRGAIGAVTRSIEDLAAKANAAKELEARLTSGQVIVELDPATVDASFVIDRMAHNDEEYQSLRDSIAQSGQDSPILVRPNPQVPGRFQVAFGHRRLRAAKDLGQPVRAVVRPLSDRELVLAQGQENSARANLTFVERARFAHRLEQNGYDRETIMLALSADKTTVSRLITVIERIPEEVIEAIGPAPATGRDRWVDLAGLFHQLGTPESLFPIVDGMPFQAAESDARFQLVLAHLTARAAESRAAPAPPARPERAGQGADQRDWTHSSGTKVLKVAHSPRSTVLTIDKRRAPGFDTYLMERMEELYSAFLADGGGSKKPSIR